MIAELKNVVPELFDTGRTGVRLGVKTVDHPPRILMLYGSVRERSYSRLATEEA
ncbi:TPA: arsenical resistance protein ArsH, partial [Klebsiella pneumoniae]|nr:arsenical resistance protein ArsH [Klebsiella pneumoniae]